MVSTQENQSTTEKGLWVISLFCAFTPCVFGIFEMFFVSYNELWFGLKEIGIISAVSFAVFWGILHLIFFAASQIADKAFLISAILFSLTISWYIQGNYANADLGVLNGAAIAWENYTSYNQISLLVWLCPIALCMIFYFVRKELLHKIIRAIAFCMLAMEIVTLLILTFQKAPDAITLYNERKNSAITNEYLFEFSPNDNVVVLLLDSFDSLNYKELLEEDEDKYGLKDFTYYPNTVGAYSTTIGAVPYIMTGVWYENDMPKEDYLEQAFEQTTLYDELEKNGFVIDIYSPPGEGLLSENVKQKCENVFDLNIIPTSYIGLGFKYYELLAFRYMPHQLKPYFWFYPEEFDNYKDSANIDHTIFNPDMQQSYQILTDGRCTINPDKRHVFKFYHVKGPHEPATFDENLQDKEDADYLDESKGSLTFVKEFLAQLQELGIYNQASIIILADHGAINYCQNPLLLVKESSVSKDFTISDAPISYEDLMPTMIYMATGEKTGRTVWEIEEDEERSRRFLQYTWTGGESWGEDYLPDLNEYFVQGNAGDGGAMYRGKSSYLPGGSTVSHNSTFVFKDGAVVNFDGGEDFIGLTRSGFCPPEKSGSGTHVCWSYGTYSTFSLRFDQEVDSDIIMRVYATPLSQEQHLNVYVDDQPVQSITDCTSGVLEICLPLDTIRNKDAIEIKLEYPNAISPYKMGTGSIDRRVLAFLYEKVEFFTTK